MSSVYLIMTAYELSYKIKSGIFIYCVFLTYSIVGQCIIIVVGLHIKAGTVQLI